MSKLLERLEKKTRTTEFIMPVFGIPEAQLEQFSFINAYIGDKDRAYVEDGTIRIHALFQPGKGTLQALNKKIEELEETGILEDEYDYEDGHVVLVFRLPAKFHDDYKLFLAGKYTKLSQDFKDIFPDKKRTGDKEEYSLHYHIFNKTSGMRKYLEQELDVEIDPNDEEFQYWVRPDYKKEILNIDKYLPLKT